MSALTSNVWRCAGCFRGRLVQYPGRVPKCLYSLSGYKVWLGSIFASKKKLVSDGADNTIIVHSFDDEEDEVAMKEDDEDDKQGFSFE